MISAALAYTNVFLMQLSCSVVARIVLARENGYEIHKSEATALQVRTMIIQIAQLIRIVAFKMESLSF